MRRLLGLFMLLLLGQVLYAQGTKNSAKQSQSSSSANATREIVVNGVKFKMIYVEGGTFTMGATAEQGKASKDDEYPAHQVTLSDYFIGETEVTQELWCAVMSWNPSSSTSSSHNPVERVYWVDCWEFIHKLNRLTGLDFRLPTEAEWEYAARGGNKSKGYRYSGSNSSSEVSWDMTAKGTHEVAKRYPNELGLYDMSGNVQEWCSDWYSSSYYSSSPSTNPTGPTSGTSRVTRGGHWGDYTDSYCRVSARSSDSSKWRSYTIGFRLVCSAEK